MLGVVLRAEQAALLAGDEQRDDRAARALVQLREGAGDRQHLGAAGGIVHRAVVDAVAAGIRRADAEVIVVRAQQTTTCAASFGSLPGRMPPTLAVCTRESVLVKLSEVRSPERHRLEGARMRRGEQLVQVLPAGLQQAPHRILGGPGLHLQARLAAGGQLELLAAPGALHHLPRITRRRGGVDDDDAGWHPGARRSRTCSPSARSTGGACRRTGSGPSPGRCS